MTLFSAPESLYDGVAIMVSLKIMLKLGATNQAGAFLLDPGPSSVGNQPGEDDVGRAAAIPAKMRQQRLIWQR